MVVLVSARGLTLFRWLSQLVRTLLEVVGSAVLPCHLGMPPKRVQGRSRSSPRLTCQGGARLGSMSRGNLQS